MIDVTNDCNSIERDAGVGFRVLKRFIGQSVNYNSLLDRLHSREINEYANVCNGGVFLIVL